MESGRKQITCCEYNPGDAVSYVGMAVGVWE